MRVTVTHINKTHEANICETCTIQYSNINLKKLQKIMSLSFISILNNKIIINNNKLLIN
jgi:hypothetical protein